LIFLHFLHKSTIHSVNNTVTLVKLFPCGVIRAQFRSTVPARRRVPVRSSIHVKLLLRVHDSADRSKIHGL